MSKRANGEGTIYYNEKKQLYQAMLTTPAGKRLTKASKDKKIVLDWLNEQRLLIGRNQHIEPHTVTFLEWVEEWLDVYAKPNVRPSSYDRYCFSLKHTEPLFNIRLTNLTPSHFQKLYNSLTDLSNSSKKHIHVCIKNLLKQAVVNNLIHKNPCDAVKAPTIIEKEIEVFTPEEVDKMLSAAQNHRYPLVITLAYTMGMRISEILGLMWEDINLDKSTLSIKRIVSRSLATGVCLSEPKTKGSKRTIFLPDETAKEIIKHKLKYGINKGLLFTTLKIGSPLSKDHYKALYVNVQKEAGVFKNIHVFRHTHASILLSKGVPIADIAQRLGHTRISTTLDTYGHFIPKAQTDVVKKLSEMLFPKS